MRTAELSGSRIEVETAPGGRFYRHGWHSWTPVRWVEGTQPAGLTPHPERRLVLYDPRLAHDDVHRASGVAAWERTDGAVELLGALDLEGVIALSGDAVVAEYLDAWDGAWLHLVGEEDEVFAAYAAALARRWGRRAGTRPRVWCSWYSYYGDVTGELVDEVVAGLGELAFDVVQIDDGWQREIGDWRPNDDFGGDLRPTAERIRASGRRAGLWLAPFIAGAGSRLVAERPELILRDAAGAPVVAGYNWGEPYHPLDLTKPEAVDAVTTGIGRAVAWGFDYLKLDFLYAAAYPGDRAEPLAGERVYRSACEAIREAVGDEVYLLACGAPVLASVGVFDGIRIGPDVGPDWHQEQWSRIGDESAAGARSAISTSVHRVWLQDVIDADPDVVYFRSRNAALDEATKSRLRQLALITGFRATSDPPSWLTREEREALEAFLLARPAIRKQGRYSWLVDDEPADFAPSLLPAELGPRWEKSA